MWARCRFWVKTRWTRWLVERLAAVNPAAINRPRAVPGDPAALRAMVLVREAERMNAGGEYKAHCVLSKLKKEFPEYRTRDLRLLIEQVVQVVGTD